MSTAEVFADDFVILVEQEGAGDAHEVVHAGDGRTLGFQVGEMFPDHTVFLDSLFPGAGIVIQREADDFQTLGLVRRVEFQYIRVFLPAGVAPRISGIVTGGLAFQAYSVPNKLFAPRFAYAVALA